MFTSELGVSCLPEQVGKRAFLIITEVKKYLIFSNFSESHSAPPFISLSSLVSVPKLGDRFTCGISLRRSWLSAAYSPYSRPVARTSSLHKLKKLTEPHIHGFSRGRYNLRRVRIISDWPKTIGKFLATFTIAEIQGAEIRGMRRHDTTMTSSKMAAHWLASFMSYRAQAFRWKQRAVSHTKESKRRRTPGKLLNKTVNWNKL